MVLRADFVDADGDRNNTSEEEDEYVLADDDESTLDDEVRDLQKELSSVPRDDEARYLKSPGRPARQARPGKAPRTVPRSQERVQGLGLDDQGVLELVDERGRPFPGAYDNALLDYYARAEVLSDTVPAPTSKKRKQLEGRLEANAVPGLSKKRTSNSNKSRSSTGSSKNVRFEAPGYDASAVSLTDQEDASSDEDFQPNAASDTDEESDKENHEPDVVSSDSSVITSASESESSDSSSSLSSSSSASSSSSSEDSSDSEPEQAPRPATKIPKIPKVASGTPSIKPSEAVSSKHQEDGKAPPRFVPPGQGQIGTKKRNQRRRDLRKFEHLKRVGCLPSDATRQNFKQWQEDSEAVKQVGEGQTAVVPQPKTVGEAEAFEAKRTELLDSIALGGVEVGLHSQKVAEDVPRDRDTLMDERPGDHAQTPNIARDSGSSNQTASEPPKRRARLDLASSRRLLFGSLGLRTPKTKDDEQTMRKRLMEQARPAVSSENVQAEKGDVRVRDVSTRVHKEATEEDDGWENKVVLKAVECCQDGVQLSTPPFPFVQRWDPQQQGIGKASNRGGKSKKRKRNQSQYYQSGEQEYNIQDSREYQQEISDAALQSNADDMDQSRVQGQPDSEDVDEALNDQLMRDVNSISATAPRSVETPEDLLQLPKDMSSIRHLTRNDALPGAVVAFKQLDMSQETNWQPKISDYRTATIIEMKDDDTIQLRLSQRDRKQNDKKYDEETGERIYAKFEMPDFDEEGAAEDDGLVETMFGDLIEPKLVQAAERQPISVAEGETKIDQDQGFTNEFQNATTGGPVSEHDAYVTAEVPDAVRDSEQSIEVNDEVRREILELMKEVGFRSSIGSAVAQTGEEAEPGSKDQDGLITEGHAHDQNSNSSSPRFNGFGSSPASEGDKDESSVARRQTSVHTNQRSPTPNSARHTPTTNTSKGEGSSPQPNVREVSQDYNTTKLEDEEQPLTKSTENNINTVQHKLRKQLQSLFASSSPGDTALPAEPPTETSPGSTKGSTGGLDGTFSDDDDFPSLDTVLSTARSSFEASGPEQKSKGKQRMSSPGKVEPISLSSPKATPYHAKAANGAADFASTLPVSSQFAVGSQIVDLTLSSDPVEPDDDDEDGEYRDNSGGLPKGPGWVAKKRKLRSGSSAKGLGKRPKDTWRGNRSL